MKIIVSVKTKSKLIGVQMVDTNHYRVSINTPPVEGKANQAVIELLAKHFHINKNQVVIVSGHKKKTKIIEISSF